MSDEMRQKIAQLFEDMNVVLEGVSAILWHEYVLFIILAIGLLFTLWSRFSQYRALTHGTAIVTGKYDDKSDPGAISHFQALSAALSATVGIGNIGGVAGAIALGGPGAVFWMWVVGVIGMALKTTEVTLAMLYRNTDDPENPHGGAMWVADKGFPRINPNLKTFGKVVAIIFCITLLISTITGGNMFQAWNVAEVTQRNFQVPRVYCGIILAILTGLVIIGGIKAIGRVAGILVPFMCLIYVAAGLLVLSLNAVQIPEMFALIFRSAFSPAEAQGAFLGGTAGYAFTWGLKRSLFSSEAGQGSAPIAHAAAKTDEPVREGLVAGLEPFIDTLIVCTLTALVVLVSGAWNRDPEMYLTEQQLNLSTTMNVAFDTEKNNWSLQIDNTRLPPRQQHYWGDGEWKENEVVFLLIKGHEDRNTNNHLHPFKGEVHQDQKGFYVKWTPKIFDVRPEVVQKDAGYPMYMDYAAAALTSHAFDRLLPGLGRWMIPFAVWLFALSTVISWSYYGEQGIVYLFGQGWVMAYRILYCVLVLVATLGFVQTDRELGNFTDLGTGVMLWANLPICLVFGWQTMRAYHDYIRRLKAGEFKRNP